MPRMAKTGGILLFIGSIIGIAGNVLILGVGMAITVAGYRFGYAIAFLGVIFIFFCFIGCIAAASCVNKGNWWFSIVGSVLCIFCVFPLYLPTIFGVLALICIAISKGEFDAMIAHASDINISDGRRLGEYQEPTNDSYSRNRSPSYVSSSSKICPNCGTVNFGVQKNCIKCNWKI